MDMPFVTVIVPAYNAKSTMALCIDSLLQIEYPKDKLEIIIVDNNSKDNTSEIIKKYPVKYLLEDNIQTSYAARNKGITEAKGEIIAFTDSDCIVDKKWIKEGIKHFNNIEIGGVGGNILSYKPGNYIECYQDEQRIFQPENLIRENKIITANAFYRKKILEEVDFFDSQMFSSGDLDLSLKVSQKYKLLYCDKSIVYHKHRVSIGALWEQHFRYGTSDLILRHRYNKLSEKIIKNRIGYIKPVYWRLRLLVLQKLIFMIINLLKCISNQNSHSIKLLQYSFLEFVEVTASFSGALNAVLKYKIPAYFFLPISENNFENSFKNYL